MVVCNLPSIRNYVNHGFFKPADIASDGLFIFASDALIKMDRIDDYDKMQMAVQNVTDVKERMRLQEKLAMQVYKTYPLMTLVTLGKLMYNAICIMGRAHWPLVANFWGYNFKDDFSPKHMPLKKLTSLTFPLHDSGERSCSLGVKIP